VKTGTTNDYRDGWAMGFTPYVTVGVWTGNNNNESIDSVGGVDTGGRIWNGIMERLFRTRELDDFLRNQGKVPLNFPDLTTYGLTEQPVCGIGSSFGGRGTEWFTKEMAEVNRSGSCGLYNAVQVVRAADGTLCLPRPGVNYGSALTTLQLPNAPQVGDDMRVLGTSGRITGGAAGAATAVAPQNVCAPGIDVEQSAASPSPSAQPSGSAALPSPSALPSASGVPQPQPVPASPVPSVPPAAVPAPSVVPVPSVPPVPAPSVPPVPAPSIAPIPAPPLPSAAPSLPPTQP
jgi:peptidoglycan glycosyltransferase